MDLFGDAGGEGLGGTTVEHRVPRSEDPSREADYANCLYACRLCNRARSSRPILGRDRRLLDPTRDAWDDHYVVSGDDLKPIAGDVDAAYTHETYDLDDSRKKRRRRRRRLLIVDRLQILAQLGGEIRELLHLAEKLRKREPSLSGRVLLHVQRLREQGLRALSDLRRYAAIPLDAPATCRCGTRDEHSLPRELAVQTLELADLSSGG